jgi:hypothetical protein
MSLWLTQPLTDMTTKNVIESKAQPARGADSLTAICEPIVCRCTGYCYVVSASMKKSLTTVVGR